MPKVGKFVKKGIEIGEGKKGAPALRKHRSSPGKKMREETCTKTAHRGRGRMGQGGEGGSETITERTQPGAVCGSRGKKDKNVTSCPLRKKSSDRSVEARGEERVAVSLWIREGKRQVWKKKKPIFDMVRRSPIKAQKGKSCAREERLGKAEGDGDSVVWKGRKGVEAGPNSRRVFGEKGFL